MTTHPRTGRENSVEPYPTFITSAHAADSASARAEHGEKAPARTGSGVDFRDLFAEAGAESKAVAAGEPGKEARFEEVRKAVDIKALRDQMLPPTMNLEHPDPECDLDYVANHSRKAKVHVALSNSFGFGGTNGSLIFKRWAE